VGARKYFFPHVFKVPRKCPLVLLAEAIEKEGKGLRSEKVKFQDMDIITRKGENLNRGFTLYEAK
jgi:hypothetical protein